MPNFPFSPFGKIMTQVEVAKHIQPQARSCQLFQLEVSRRIDSCHFSEIVLLYDSASCFRFHCHRQELSVMWGAVMDKFETTFSDAEFRTQRNTKLLKAIALLDLAYDIVPNVITLQRNSRIPRFVLVKGEHSKRKRPMSDHHLL